MDGESRSLLEDCFLRAPADARSTNAGQSSKVVSKNPMKAELQLLRLNEDIQNNVMSTLKYIHGDDFELGSIADYKDEGSKIKNAYWKEKGTLIIQGGCDFSNISNQGQSGGERMKLYALMKLESYGFHRSHCYEVLEAFHDNIDDCINLLFDKYFPTFKKHVQESQDQEFQHLCEMRTDEKEALESIYDKLFHEIEKNNIWQIKLRLDYLLKFSPSEVKKEEKRKQEEIEQKLQEMMQSKKKKKPKKEKCRNMMEKGKCRFGHNCKFSHDIYADDEETNQESGAIDRKPKLPNEDDEKIWYLEIRFPQWCKYPYEAPIILLRTKISDISKGTCLRINQKLIDLSRELAQDGIPSVYSLVECLQNSEEILSYLNKNLSFKYPNPNQSIFDYDPYQDGEENSEEATKDLPTHYKQGRVDKFDKKNLTPEQLLQDNLHLIKRFCNKQQDSYYQKMLKVRKDLPAWSQKKEILETIRNNQVVVISGETGCGKSTQIPQFLLDEWFENSSKSKSNFENIDIVCTQPRRISAIGVAERVSDERNEKIGNVVGYQIRLENKISTQTRLTFCTTGILLRRMYSDPMMEGVTHLIIDEVHERSEESDFLLLILREVLAKRMNLKVILMSATLNSRLFSDYFCGAPVLNIPGRTFPVQQIFLEEILERTGYVIECDSQYCKKITKKDEEQLMQELEYSDVKASNSAPHPKAKDENLNLSELIARYIDYSKQTCKTLFLTDPLKINPELIENVLRYICVDGDHDWPREGTILVFLPGLAEIQSVYDTLMDSKEFSTRSGSYVIIPLHSSLTSEEQSRVFKKAPPGKRKIVLSTNIAETSITIDDCVFVIDCGQMKEKNFDSNRNMESLDTVWISKANANQRKGRAGRVMPGICVHLFTHHRYKYNMLQQPVPEIHRVPLEQLLLRIKTLPNFSKETLLEVLKKSIEPPNEESVYSAIKRLQNLGAFDMKECLTALGRHLSLLPVDVKIGKLVLFGAIFQCLDSVLTIAACLSHKSPFVSPFSKRKEADARKRQFGVGNSDHLTMLNAYNKWRDARKRSKQAGNVYADENYLSYRTLEMLGEIKFQFLELLVSIGFVSIDLPTIRKSKSRNFEDTLLELTGNEWNANGNNSRLLVAILFASLYPNVAKILTPETNYIMSVGGAMPKQHLASDLKFKTKDDGYVSLHPSSINATLGVFNSPFLIYQEKVKTSKIFIRETSSISTISLILFSGSDIKIELHNGDFMFLLEDNWIVIQAESVKVAESVKYMRKELMSILEEKISDPLLNLLNHDRGKRIIATIILLISKV